MKIVFLQDDFPPRSFGGAGISTFELAQAVRAQGHDVAVITTCSTQSEAGEAEYQGLRVFSIASSYPGYLRAYKSINNRAVVRQVEELLARLKPDVVHANNIHAHLSYAVLPAAKRHAKAVVLTFRDTMAVTYGKLDTERYLQHHDPRTTWRDHLAAARKRYNPLRNVLIKRYLRSCDALFAVSNALRDALAAHGIAGVSAMHTGMDTAQWQVPKEAVAAFKQKHGLAGKQVVLFGGRLSAEKGGGVSLAALALVAHTYKNAVLMVVGVVDDFARAMQHEAERLGVAGRVVYTGWIDGDEKRAAFCASDVVLVPSIYLDPLPRVVLEAMAAGKPVVATRYGGAPEAVVDGETGYVVDPRKPKDIAAKLGALLGDPAKAAAMGAAARARIEQDFNLASVAERYVDAYRRVIDHK